MQHVSVGGDRSNLSCDPSDGSCDRDGRQLGDRYRSRDESSRAVKAAGVIAVRLPESLVLRCENGSKLRA